MLVKIKKYDERPGEWSHRMFDIYNGKIIDIVKHDYGYKIYDDQKNSYWYFSPLNIEYIVDQEDQFKNVLVW